MSRRLYEVPGVVQDLTDYYDIIEQDQPDAADRMLLAYHDLTERLRNWPLSGNVLETAATDLQTVRIGRLASPFHAYQVFYLPETDSIRVLDVVHAAIGEERRLRLLNERTHVD